MNVRRLSRWAVRAAVIGALLGGGVYTAADANAGAIWAVLPSPSSTPAADTPTPTPTATAVIPTPSADAP